MSHAMKITFSCKDKHLHLFKHACNENHKHVDLGNTKFIDSGYHNNRFKRKMSEALNSINQR